MWKASWTMMMEMITEEITIKIVNLGISIKNEAEAAEEEEEDSVGIINSSNNTLIKINISIIKIISAGVDLNGKGSSP